jgi:hypothetical protein
MKNVTMKKSILNKLALITAITFISSYAYGEHNDNNQKKISIFRKTFIGMEYYLTEFVSITNKTSFNDFNLKMKELLHRLQRHIEELTRTQGNDLSKEIDNLMDYVLQQFNILCNVFTKYNGKPDSQALNFAGEIKKEFDTEKIFGVLISKLKVLKNKACNANEEALAKEIAALISVIEDKRNRWNKKSNPELFAGISHRMKC